MEKYVIFDIEVYKDFLYFNFLDEGGKEYEFEFSSRNWDEETFKEFLKTNKDKFFVGFNILRFDAPILTIIIDMMAKNMHHGTMLSYIYAVANNIVRENRKYPYKYFTYLDLAEIGGYNYKATHASLKQIEFNLRMDIETTPVRFDKEPNPEEVELIKEYCRHDVKATKMLFDTMQDEIRVRLDPTYKGILNLPNSKLGETILQQELGLPYLYVDREKFEKVRIKDIIYPYVEFSIPAFRELKSYLESKEIDTPNGFFSEIPEEELGDLVFYMDTKKKKGNIEHLNVIFNNMVYYIGSGGIHASRTGIFVSTKRRVIYDYDVKSYYPFNIINNKLIPEMVARELRAQGKPPEYFLEKYKSFYERRKLYKKPHPLNLLYKLALNIIFGKSLQPSSIFGDIKLGLSVTINGQLLLLMLIEWLHKEIPDITMIQANTDGITFETDREYEENVKKVISKWEEITGFIMERTIYDKMVIANVNNYIAVDESGKVKQKGKMFSYRNLEHYKDHSELIVPKALEAYFIYGQKYRQYIRQHKDVYDFAKRVRVNRGSKLVFRTENDGVKFETPLGNIVRYFVTKKGGKLIKILPPLAGSFDERETEVEAGRFVEIHNKMPEKHSRILRNLDYNYYIEKVEKVIQEIHNGC